MEESSERLKESSQRRFRLQASRFDLDEDTKGPLHRRPEAAAHAEAQLQATEGLRSLLFRLRQRRLQAKEDTEKLLEERSEAQLEVSKNRGDRDGFFEDTR